MGGVSASRLIEFLIHHIVCTVASKTFSTGVILTTVLVLTYGQLSHRKCARRPPSAGNSWSSLTWPEPIAEVGKFALSSSMRLA